MKKRKERQRETEAVRQTYRLTNLLANGQTLYLEERERGAARHGRREGGREGGRESQRDRETETESDGH